MIFILLLLIIVTTTFILSIIKITNRKVKLPPTPPVPNNSKQNCTLAKNGVPCYLINKILTPKPGKHAIAVCNNKWNSKSSENDVTLISIILFLLKYL